MASPRFKKFFALSIHFSAVRIDLFIVGAGQAEGLGVHVAAPVSPHIEFAAIYTQGCLATVAKDDGRFLMTSPADLASICNNHIEKSLL
jgi:hypothetical protein